MCATSRFYARYPMGWRSPGVCAMRCEHDMASSKCPPPAARRVFWSPSLRDRAPVESGLAGRSKTRLLLVSIGPGHGVDAGGAVAEDRSAPRHASQTFVWAGCCSSGHLLYVRGNTLAVQPINPATLELSGGTTVVADNLPTSGSFSVRRQRRGQPKRFVDVHDGAGSAATARLARSRGLAARRRSAPRRSRTSIRRFRRTARTSLSTCVKARIRIGSGALPDQTLTQGHDGDRGSAIRDLVRGQPAVDLLDHRGPGPTQTDGATRRRVRCAEELSPRRGEPISVDGIAGRPFPGVQGGAGRAIRLAGAVRSGQIEHSVRFSSSTGRVSTPPRFLRTADGSSIRRAVP